MNRIGLSIASFLSISATGLAWAHHSVAPFYRMDETRRIEGIVTRFEFANPHSRVYVNVADENGEVTEWMVEGEAGHVLRDRGWSSDDLSPGDHIVAEGLASRDGSPRVAWQVVRLTDGTELRGGGAPITEEMYENMDRQRERASAASRDQAGPR